MRTTKNPEENLFLLSEGGHAVDNIFPSADASDRDHEKQLHH